jgi:hypothetical protein
MSPRRFDEWEDELLREFYDLTPRQLGEILSRPKGSVFQRMKRLGIVLPPEMLADRRNGSLFKKGAKSHNSGKKGVAAPGSEKGWFKKGSIPHNAKSSDGEIVLRKDKRGNFYWHIRVALGKWEALARVVWATYNGPIPKGHAIIHRNGDTNDCSPRNLACVSRGTLYRLNSGSFRLTDRWVAFTMAGRNRGELRTELEKHPELLELRRQQIILNRSLK